MNLEGWWKEHQGKERGDLKENRQEGEGGSGVNWETRPDVSILPGVKQPVGTAVGTGHSALSRPRRLEWGRRRW